MRLVVVYECVYASRGVSLDVMIMALLKSAYLSLNENGMFDSMSLNTEMLLPHQCLVFRRRP